MKWKNHNYSLVARPYSCFSRLNFVIFTHITIKTHLTRFLFYCLLVFRFSFKINELIQSFQAGVYFFQLLLKILVFQLNNRFEFHRFWAVDIQSVRDILEIIHDFLASGNKVRLSVSVFHVVSVRNMTSWPNGTLLQSHFCG